jgi:hypothetical protein
MVMADQLCPECGCHIGKDAYTEKEVVYCCRACATGDECDCGACEKEDIEEREPG